MPGAARNHRHAALVVVAFAAGVLALFLLVGLLVGNVAVAGLVGLGIVLAWVLIAVLWGDRLVLAASRARPVAPDEHRRYVNLVEGLCVTTGLRPPRLYVVEDTAANALVCGGSQRHASLALTTGLLGTLDRVELEAVVAQLLGRIKAGEIRAGTLAAVTIAGPAFVGDWFVRLAWWGNGRTPREGERPDRRNPLALVGFALLVLGPVLGPLVRLAAGPDVPADDQAGARITRYPPGLANALADIDAHGTVTHAALRAAAHLWLGGPLALTPADGRLSGWNQWWDRRPSLAVRVESLREL